MQIEELIRETLQKMKIESEQQKENKKHVKMLNKVGKDLASTDRR